jgi:hypothetical protein
MKESIEQRSERHFYYGYNESERESHIRGYVERLAAFEGRDGLSDEEKREVEYLRRMVEFFK